MVFTTRHSGGSRRGARGRNAFEHELRRLGVQQKNSRPKHLRKVERFHETLKAWLRAQPNQPTIIEQLQAGGHGYGARTLTWNHPLKSKATLG